MVKRAQVQKAKASPEKNAKSRREQVILQENNPCAFCSVRSKVQQCRLLTMREIPVLKGYEQFIGEGKAFGVCKARACLRLFALVKETAWFHKESEMRLAGKNAWLAELLTCKNFTVLGECACAPTRRFSV
jgi:hypothetical protein